MLKIVRARRGNCKVCLKALSKTKREYLGYQIQYRKRRVESPELTFSDTFTHRINLCDQHFTELFNMMKKTIEMKEDV